MRYLIAGIIHRLADESSALPPASGALTVLRTFEFMLPGRIILICLKSKKSSIYYKEEILTRQCLYVKPVSVPAFPACRHSAGQKLTKKSQETGEWEWDGPLPPELPEKGLQYQL